MSKIPPTQGNKFPFKCADIYCTAPSKYSVSCCLCNAKIPLEGFHQHFYEHFDRVKSDYSKNVSIVSTGSIKVEYDDEDDLRSGKQQQEFSFEELDEKPIDFIDLKNAQELEVNASMFIRSEREKTRQTEFTQLPGVTEFDEDREFLDHDRDSDWKDDWADSDQSEKVDSCVCPKCSRVLKNKTGLQTHLRSHKRSDIGKWQESLEGGGSFKDLKTNKEIEIPSFPCAKCSRVFEKKSSLQNHMRSHKSKDDTTEHKCEECGEVFQTIHALHCHRRTHTSWKCDICDKVFKQIYYLQAHKVRHTGIKAHKCPKCNYSCFGKNELRAHMISHLSTLPVICELCGRTCRNSSLLRYHMQRHTGERPWKCSVCGKSFFSKFDLKVHSVSHTNERPFACDLCNSTFKSKKSLRVHKLQHIPERNFVCRVCDKAFALEKGLASHIRTHGLDPTSTP